MIARLDNENLYYMESDDVYVWDEASLLCAPKFPWEVIQIGNCGSPIETEAGWLLLTHGVGPMRQYCIGATLLDRDDPSRIIGQTSEPLLVPTGSERIRLCPQRRLLLRRHDPRGQADSALRDERPGDQHRHHRPAGVARSPSRHKCQDVAASLTTSVRERTERRALVEHAGRDQSILGGPCWMRSLISWRVPRSTQIPSSHQVAPAWA